jgi:hypothetical protein
MWLRTLLPPHHYLERRPSPGAAETRSGSKCPRLSRFQRCSIKSLSLYCINQLYVEALIQGASKTRSFIAAIWSHRKLSDVVHLPMDSWNNGLSVTSVRFCFASIAPHLGTALRARLFCWTERARLRVVDSEPQVASALRAMCGQPRAKPETPSCAPRRRHQAPTAAANAGEFPAISVRFAAVHAQKPTSNFIGCRRSKAESEIKFDHLRVCI